MIRYILIIIICQLLTIKSDTDNSNIDDDVVSFLMNNNTYNKLVRPIKKVNVTFILSYKQLVSLDEKTQILTSNVNIFASWYDSRLKWVPNDFGNLTDIVIPATELWLPDFAVINTASTSVFITINNSNLANVASDGLVWLVISIPIMQTKCKINVFKFPFDKQNCSIVIGSWQLDSSRIDFISDESKFSTDDYIPNAVWNLDKIEVFNISSSQRVEIIEDIVYNIIISRRPLYYMTTFIPCYILNVATLLAFFVTNSIVVQVNLCMTVFLTFGVYSLKIAGDITTQSEYFPLANIYFITAIIYTLICLMWFIFANYCLTQNKLPKCLQHIARCVQFLKFIFPNSKVKLKEKDQEERIEDSENIEINDKIETTSSYNNLRNRKSTLQQLEKSTCNKCEMCKECRENISKDNEKKKAREILESNLFALNLLVCFIVFSIMFSTYLGIWVAAVKS